MDSDDSHLDPDVSAAQIRAARTFLDWTLANAAKRMNVSVSTLHRLEAGKRMPGSRTLREIVEVLEASGIEFVRVGKRRGVFLSGSDT